MLDNLKKKVVQIAKESEKWGLCIPKAGNFSIRDHETGYVLITPTGVTRDMLDYTHIIVMDLEGNIIDVEDKNVKPTVEGVLHLQVYKERKDVFGIVHTHSKYASVFAALEENIDSVIFDALHYGGKTALAPYGRPGTDELAKTIIEPIKKADVVIMAKHGVLAVGKDIDKAFLNALYVEQVAEINILAKLYGGKTVQPIPQEEFDALAYHR
jgi:L-ribulose-5-phosphate 4-epimerase